MPSKKPPQLRVVFDTSVLFTGSASDLINHELSSLIERNSDHGDLRVSWSLPQMVINERKFQMMKSAKSYMPSIGKLERLLGHNLNITEEILANRIDIVVETQLNEHGMDVLGLDNEKVDWDKITYNAAFRNPPFEDSKSEKGFRDAIIAETFVQLIDNSPKTPSRCRLVMVSSDKLLQTSIQARTSDAKNIRLLDSLDELGGLINTLVSEVTEAFVSKIVENAHTYFFSEDAEASLYMRENVTKLIVNQFSKELSEYPEGANSRENETWWIHPPNFVSKSGQRITWNSRIMVDATAYYQAMDVPLKWEDYAASGIQVNPSHASGSFVGYFPAPDPSKSPPTIDGTRYSSFPMVNTGDLIRSGSSIAAQNFPRQVKRIVASGKTKFDVIWSVSVSTKSKLSRGKIESIVFAGTSWDE